MLILDTHGKLSAEDPADANRSACGSEADDSPELIVVGESHRGISKLRRALG